MTYSFTKPQKRPLFSLLDRIWIVLFGFAFVFIFFVFVIYEFRIIFTNNDINNKKKNIF